jgi:hypothetical protein
MTDDQKNYCSAVEGKKTRMTKDTGTGKEE